MTLYQVNYKVYSNYLSLHYNYLIMYQNVKIGLNIVIGHKKAIEYYMFRQLIIVVQITTLNPNNVIIIIL